MEEIKPKFKTHDLVMIENENFKGIYEVEDYTIEDSKRVSYRASDGNIEFWFGEEEVIEFVGNNLDEV